MRTQFHFWPTTDSAAFDAWDVARLVDLARALPVVEVRVSSITEVDTDYWTDAGTKPSVRRVVDHARMILSVDPAFPIILGPDGRLMDGMHRVCRAILDGRQTIAAVRFESLPEPDVRHCQLADFGS